VYISNLDSTHKDFDMKQSRDDEYSPTVLRRWIDKDEVFKGKFKTGVTPQNKRESKGISYL